MAFYSLEGYRSGEQLSFEIALLDEEGNLLNYEVNKVTNKEYPAEIEEEIKKYVMRIAIDNDNIKIYGSYIIDYLRFDQK